MCLQFQLDLGEETDKVVDLTTPKKGMVSKTFKHIREGKNQWIVERVEVREIFMVKTS